MHKICHTNYNWVWNLIQNYVNRAENFRIGYPDRLVWISNLETFNFLLNPVMLDITFPYYVICTKYKFDYKSRYYGISIGLISDWTKLRNYGTKSIQMETYGNATNKFATIANTSHKLDHKNIFIRGRGQYLRKKATFYIMQIQNMFSIACKSTKPCFKTDKYLSKIKYSVKSKYQLF